MRAAPDPNDATEYDPAYQPIHDAILHYPPGDTHNGDTYSNAVSQFGIGLADSKHDRFNWQSQQLEYADGNHKQHHQHRKPRGRTERGDSRSGAVDRQLAELRPARRSGDGRAMH